MVDYLTVVALIKQQAEESPSDLHRSFWLSLESLVEEQQRRIVQAEEELEGSIWSPNGW